METTKYDPSKGLGPIYRVLLRGAASHKSANELSALTNGVIKPADALARVFALLDSRDVYSQAYMRMLLIDEMMQVKDELLHRVLEFRSKDDTKPLISMLTLIDKTLAADKFDINAAMSQISRAHAQLMLQALNLAFERAVLELEKRYPEISAVELREVLNTALPVAIREIESRVPGE